MKIDLHCHSKYSCDNNLEPEDLIEQAIRLNLDGVCFTEHYSPSAYWNVEEINVPDGFYVFRGLEISTDRGHVLVYGLKNDDWNRWPGNNYLNVFKVIEAVHHLGGICVPAHPFRGGESFGEALFRIEGFDAVETHNGRNSSAANRRAAEAARLMNLPSVGGSDCHEKIQVGRAFTIFDNPVRTLEELLSEIKMGNCKGVKA